MKIALRGFGSRELTRKMEKCGAADPVGGIHNEMFFDSVWPNPQLAEFLLEAAKSGSFDLNPWMTFSRTDIERAGFLRVRPRKVIEDSTTDYERMRSDFDRLPWIGDDPKLRFRLPERVSLTKIPLKPNQVAIVGEWTAEFVIPRNVRTIFEDGTFSGVEFRPIINTRTSAPFDDYFQIYSDHILGRRVLDIASPEIRSPLPLEQGYEALGCLCYDGAKLEQALDFNRTGEPNKSFEFPDWIVSSSVRECFREHKLRGWAFEPVLQPGTQTYEEYDELWTSFRRMLGACKRHTVRSQSFGLA